MTAVLTTKQLHGALEATGEFARLEELSEFPRRAAITLRRLIPCEHSGYNVIDLETGRATVIAEPADVVYEGGPEALARLGNQNPIILRALGGDTSPLRLSDFVSRRDLHRTELYHEVYRRIGLEYQLALRLPAPRRALGRPSELVGIDLARAHRDFSAADLLMLELLAPHFTATLERLHERALLRALVAGHRRDGAHVLLIDRVDEMVAWADERTEAELGVRGGGRLPAGLRQWLVAARPNGRAGMEPAAPHRLALDGRHFAARLVPNAYPELDALHLTPDRILDAARLRALGLTRRQAEVHALAMQGQTSRQIADALVLSPRTVEKHLEGIYERLGVTNRAEAVVATLAALEG